MPAAIPPQLPFDLHVLSRATCGADPETAAELERLGLDAWLEQQLDPGPPVEGNGYRSAVARELPQTWQEAIDRAAESEFLHAALGEDFLRIYLAIKRQECEKFSAQVTELDYSWYLRSV